jgi:hypothetical protein
MPRAAPAWVWGLALGGALVIALALACLDRLWPGLPALASAHLELGRLDLAPGPLPRVVALGDSRLRFAIEHDRQLTRPGSGQNQHLAVDFIRITWNNARHDDLAPALAKLCAQPPDLLLLQADPLIWRRNAAANARDEIRRRIRDNLRRLRLWALGPNPDFSAENRGVPGVWRPLVAADDPERPAKLRQIYAEALRRWQPAATEDLAAWLTDLSCLQRAGTAIVLLHFPRAPFAQAMLPAAMADHEARSLAALSDRRGWPVWSPPPGFADQDFFDEAHMSALGGHRYSAWLRTALRQWQQQHDAAAAPEPAPGQTPDAGPRP